MSTVKRLDASPSSPTTHSHLHLKKRPVLVVAIAMFLAVLLALSVGTPGIMAWIAAAEPLANTFAPLPAVAPSSIEQREPMGPAAFAHATDASEVVDDKVVSVAVATLFTTSHRTPDGVAPSIDGAFVLRHSVLRTLLNHTLTVLQHAMRKVGLPSYSPYVEHPQDGVRNERVTVYRFPHPTRTALVVELRFVALVTDSVPPHLVDAIRQIGYEIWPAHPPIAASEIRNEQIRNETLIDGAMGIAELTKLEGLRMTAFDKVLMVDCDVMFHRPFFEDGALLDVDAPLGWTKGGWASEKINGGFLVFSPRAQFAKTHLDHIVELLREGDFRPGTGWKGRGIGWTYGGRTIQGILPHYFFLEAPSVEPNAHVELNRCRYNNMVQLPPCKQTPFREVTSNHFTGDCIKPWACVRRDHPLCAQFVDAWLTVYREALVTDVAVRNVVANNARLAIFAMSSWKPSGGSCPGRGDFVSVANTMVAAQRRR